MLARERVSRDGTDVAASRASQTSVELVSPRPHPGNRGSPSVITHPRRTAGHSAAGSCTCTPRGLSRSWRETDGTAWPPRPHISGSRESKIPADALGAVLRACVSGRDMGRPVSLAFVLGDSGGPFSPPGGRGLSEIWPSWCPEPPPVRKREMAKRQAGLCRAIGLDRYLSCARAA